MTGAFEVGLFDARGMSDADFMALYRELKGDTFDKIRKDLPLVQKAGGLNLCKDMLAAFLLNRVLSGPTLEWPFDQLSGTYQGAPLFWINLSTRDNEPTYTEWDGMATYSGNLHQVSYSANTSSGSKYFLNSAWSPNEIITHYVYDDPSGREAIWSRSQWLWLPSEGISNNIRSLTAWFCYSTSIDHYKADINRIRLKDAGGTPVIINKTSNQVLLVEYIFKQFTV